MFKSWTRLFFLGEGCHPIINLSYGFPNPPICSLFSWPHDSQKFAEGAVKPPLLTMIQYSTGDLWKTVRRWFPPHVCRARNVNVPQEVILSLSPHAAVVFPPSLSTQMKGLRTALCRKDATHPGHAFGRGLVGMPRLATLAWGRGVNFVRLGHSKSISNMF